jgi:hypothetical protein
MALRLVSIGFFLAILWWQLNELYRNHLKSLQPLRWRLFAFVAALMLSNAPIMLLHYVRMVGIEASDLITEIATITNAASMLIVAIMLFDIYRYRG